MISSIYRRFLITSVFSTLALTGCSGGSGSDGEGGDDAGDEGSAMSFGTMDSGMDEGGGTGGGSGAADETGNGGDGEGPCDDGMIGCGPMICVDPMTDPMNCGNCGNTCEGDRMCIEGSCGFASSQAGTFTVTSSSGEDLTGVAVPIVLSPENFDYASATEGGANVRASSNGVADDLPYYIETWDPEGESTVWVRLDLPAGASVDVDIITLEDGGGASAFTGNDVFAFFEDFQGDVMEKWNLIAVTSAGYEGESLVVTHEDVNWASFAAQRFFEYPIVIHYAYTAGERGGIAIGESDGGARYMFDASGGAEGSLGTSHFTSFEGNRENTDMAYPALPAAVDGAAEYELAIGIVDGELDVMEYCNVTADVCADPTALSVLEEYGPRMRIGFSMSSNTITIEKFFIARYLGSMVSVAPR